MTTSQLKSEKFMHNEITKNPAEIVYQTCLKLKSKRVFVGTC